MAEHVPHYHSTPPVSLGTTAAVDGGQCVEITGNKTVGPAGAASAKCIGVAGRDAGGTGEQNQTVVYVDGVHDLTASGAIAAGAQVVCGAAGTVAALAAAAAGDAADVNNARAIIGTALEAISDTAKGAILLRLG